MFTQEADFQVLELLITLYRNFLGTRWKQDAR